MSRVIHTKAVEAVASKPETWETERVRVTKWNGGNFRLDFVKHFDTETQRDLRDVLDALLAPAAPVAYTPRVGDIVRVVNEAWGDDCDCIVLRDGPPWGRMLPLVDANKPGDLVGTITYVRPATPAERLAAGLPVETSVTPPASGARPTHVRVIDCRGLPQFRGEIVTVTRWSDEGKPFAPGCSGDFELPDGSWEPLTPSPSPAGDEANFEVWYRNYEDGAYAPGSGNYNDHRELALAAYLAGLRAAGRAM